MTETPKPRPSEDPVLLRAQRDTMVELVEALARALSMYVPKSAGILSEAREQVAAIKACDRLDNQETI